LRLKINSRGQGSSVFQLLIAAVVAVAILGVLLNILGVIKTPGSGDAASVAKQKLQEAFQNPGTPKVSEKVQMKKDSVITGVGVVGTDLGISSEEVCLGAADDLSALITVSGSVMTYNSSTSREVKVMAVCHPDAANLRNYITNDLAAYNISDMSGNCESATGIACFVGVIKG
jgi:hypothetical protein